MLSRIVVALLLLATPASADVWNFATPSGNIRCSVGESRTSADIECTIYKRSAAARIAAVRSCPLSKGINVSMLNTGRVTAKCVSGKNPGYKAQSIAEYGVEGRFGGFVCFSARTGLQCRNESGHGFHLSRANQSAF